MKTELTPQAENKLRDIIGNKPGSVRLIYDTEGCGCAVNGIPGLRIIHQPDAEDMPLNRGETVALYMNRRQEVFFEDNMKLDLMPDACGFRLDSPGETYGTNIQVMDTRIELAASKEE